MTEEQRQAALDAFNRIYDHLDACEVMADSIHNDMNIIAEDLKRNSAPAIEGLDEAITYVNDFAVDVDEEGLDRDGNARHFFAVVKAARAYAELQKGA